MILSFPNGVSRFISVGAQIVGMMIAGKRAYQVTLDREDLHMLANAIKEDPQRVYQWLVGSLSKSMNEAVTAVDNLNQACYLPKLPVDGESARMNMEVDRKLQAMSLHRKYEIVGMIEREMRAVKKDLTEGPSKAISDPSKDFPEN